VVSVRGRLVAKLADGAESLDLAMGDVREGLFELQQGGGPVVGGIGQIGLHEHERLKQRLFSRHEVGQEGIAPARAQRTLGGAGAVRSHEARRAWGVRSAPKSVSSV